MIGRQAGESVRKGFGGWLALATLTGMAITDSREVVIDATPEQVLDVIADVTSAPDWSSQHQGAEIVDTDENGRPHRVKLKLKTMGISDEQVVDYTWNDLTVSWVLVSSGQLKTQDATYTLTPDGDKTKVRFEITVDPAVPIPGFVMKRAMKGGLESATDGLRKQVHKVKKKG
jgi:ribosome-associated toxin RatA of RatAB toxin-antitoxin module